MTGYLLGGAIVVEQVFAIPGPRPPDPRRHRRAQLSADPGDDPGGDGGLRARELPRRPALHRRRPPREGLKPCRVWPRTSFSPSRVVLVAIQIILAVGAPLFAPYDPMAQSVARRLRGADRAELARHRPARARRADPHPLRLSHLAHRLPARGRRRASRRRHARARRRLLPRLARPHHHARHGRALRLPGHAARHRHHRGARAAYLQRGRRHRGGLHADLRAAPARPGAGPVRERIRGRRASAIGASDARIIFLHILPNLASVILVQTSLLLSAAILVEASLSFLGLGTQPPTPSLGLDAVGGPQLPPALALERDLRRASPSCSCPSASISWAMPCATPSTRA